MPTCAATFEIAAGLFDLRDDAVKLAGLKLVFIRSARRGGLKATIFLGRLP